MTSQLPRISTQELEHLSFKESKLKVVIKQVSGYFMPFVYESISENDTKLHGVIVDGDNVVATIELADAIFAVKELIGAEHIIVTPETPGRQMRH